MNLTESCKNAIQLDQLTPADDIRKLVEDFKGGGTLYKEKNEPKETVHKEVVEDICNKKPVEEKVFDPEIVVKKEPVDFESGEIVFSGDSELSAKIAEKSAELRARLAQCKLSGDAAVGGAVSEKIRTDEQTSIESEKSRTNENTSVKSEKDYNSKTSEIVISELNDTGKIIDEVSVNPKYGEESMETSQTEPEYSEEYGEPAPTYQAEEQEYGEEEYGESAPPHETEEYSESSQKQSISIKSEVLYPSSSQSASCLLCNQAGHDLSSCPEVKCKNCGATGHALFNCPDKFYSAPNSVESALSGDPGNFSPKKEPGLCTPTSSGYWSDDAKEGPYFGKLR